MIVPLRRRLRWLAFKLDFLFYKMLGLFASSDGHKRWSLDELRAAEPALWVERNPFVWAYREYLVDQSRLVISLLRDAVLCGAECANYVRVESVEFNGEQYSLNARDLIAGEDMAVRSRCVVNAAGPWLEQLMVDGKKKSLIGKNARLHLSKGVHISVPHEALPLRNLVFMEAEDGQIISAFPMARWCDGHA